MHDDSSLTLGRVKRVLVERIRPAVYSATRALDVSWHELPSEPVAPAEGLNLTYTPTSVGTAWGAAWGTTWFHLTGTIPEQWAGRRVEAVIDLGFDVNRTGFQCEGLVYRPDGHTIKALNPRNQWVPITDSARGGEAVDLYLEAASNPVLLDEHPFLPTEQGDILTSSAQRLYRTRRMDLAVFEPEVHALMLDLEVLFELQEQLPAAPRRAQILQAMDNALDVLDLQHIVETAAAARAELAAVLAAPAEHSAHQISAIGHSHIDSAWLWPLRETIRKVSRTCSSMVELIDADPDFLYGMSSAQQYKWLKSYRPEVWERVKRAVAEGRFLPLGGMWVESDTVMPSGESLVRQFQYGQNFFRREFGITSSGVWLPDSFGYSPALPQLMRRAGFEWFFTQKISWNQRNKFPHHSFNWEGIDGSRIFSHFPSMDTYNSQLSGEEVAKASRQFREARVANNSIAPVGWGDGGGGTTREMTGKASRLANLEGSAQVRWEHPDEFFQRAKRQLPDPPVWVGELYLELHRATLTSQHQTKQGNRRSEQLLVEAELWAATAQLYADAPYPYEDLDELWETVLLHQFHDILPGTSIAWVHREVVARYAEVIERAEHLISRAQQALAGQGGQQLDFNSVSFTTAGVRFGAAAAVKDSAPEEVNAQPVDGGYVLDNGVVRVQITKQGLISSAVDLASGREAIAEGQYANLLQLHQDFPNMWDAWDVDKFYRNRATDLVECDSMELKFVDGAAVLSIARSFSRSTLVQELSLAPGARTVQISQSTDWHETEKFLKVAFPLDIRAEHTAAETQFGFHKRVTHVNTSWEAAKFETSMHRFVLVEEPGFGAALVNDSIYGFDVSRDAVDARVSTTVRLSLLRAPRFPDPRTDQGIQTHRYGLIIGADAALATQEGARLNGAVRRVSGSREVQPLVELQGEGLVVSSVKLASDRSGDLVVRFYESLGRRSRGSLRVNHPVIGAQEVDLLEDPLHGLDVADQRIEVALGAFEVRTVRFTPA